MPTNDQRPGFVRFQQELALEALRRGSLGAARVALRILQTGDFAGGEAVSASPIAVLRNPRSSEEEVLAAVRTLVDLGPAGGR